MSSDNDDEKPVPKTDDEAAVEVLSVTQEPSPAKASLEKASPEKTGPASAKSQSRGSSWGLFKGLVWLLIVGVIVAGGYYAWPTLKRYPERVNNLEQANQSTNEQLLALERQLQNTQQQLQQQMSTYQQQLSDAEQNSQQLRAQLQEQQRQISTITTTTSDDWKLAEAYYLTRMASQRLLMERNASGALALLQSADQIVKGRADPQLHQVRKQIAEDIVALKLFNEVDREGVFLQLSAMAQQVEKLPLAQVKNYGELNSSNTAANSSSSNTSEDGFMNRVKNSFYAAVENMKGFIRITHAEQALQVPPSIEQQQWLRYNIQSLLQSAQLGLLRDQQEVYKSSLQQAQSLLQANYTSRSSVENMVSTLAELQALNFDRELPDISQSEKILGDYVDRLHRIQSDGNDANNSNNGNAEATPESL